ncbi:hypothetical protein [Oricola nitratireducens]|uniref:hypothetical protein n=1 Tax=Oricola nitratireducens TaxID=2775868 RepID=UPI001868FACB|nr:hypothetical protein [Oricola nitratireducens]
MHALRSVAVAAALVAASMTPVRAHAPDGAAFVAAFRAVCLPQRLSYDGMIDLAGSLGWRTVVPGSSEELAAILKLADDAIAKNDGDVRMARSAFERVVAGKLHHLLLSHIVAPEAPAVTSCALYDFGATEQIDAQLVTDVVGVEQKRYFVNDGFHAYSWGVTPAMPGTFQTVLTFVAEDSPHVEKTGFSGLVLKIDSTDPDAVKAEPDAKD